MPESNRNKSRRLDSITHIGTWEDAAGILAIAEISEKKPNPCGGGLGAKSANRGLDTFLDSVRIPFLSCSLL